MVAAAIAPAIITTPGLLMPVKTLWKPEWVAGDLTTMLHGRLFVFTGSNWIRSSYFEGRWIEEGSSTPPLFAKPQNIAGEVVWETSALP